MPARQLIEGVERRGIVGTLARAIKKPI